MWTEKNRSPEDKGLKNSSTLLADSRAAKWRFTKRSEIDLTEGQERPVKVRKVNNNIDLLRCSIASSVPAQAQQPEIQDVEMIDPSDDLYTQRSENDLILQEPRTRGQQRMAEQKELKEGFGLSGCSIASSVSLQAHRPEMQDVEIIDLSDDLYTLRSRRLKDPTLTKSLPYQYRSVVYIDGAGHVEEPAQVTTNGNSQGQINPWISLPPTSAKDKAVFSTFNEDVAKNFPTIQIDSLPNLANRCKLQELDEDDDIVAEDIHSEDQIADNLGSLVISRPKKAASIPCRPILQVGKSEVDAVNHGNENLRKGLTVELMDGSFLRIESVWKSGDLVTIQGYRLQRSTFCGSKLPDLYVNELIWVSEIDGQEHQDGLESALQEVQVSEVKRLRNVVFTNQPHSELSFKNELEESKQTVVGVDKALVQETGQLYCRWKYTQVHNELKTDAEASITLLSYDEATGPGSLQPSELRRVCRGGTTFIPGGSSTKTLVNRRTGRRTEVQQYTLGDSFCGAGGISRGAIQANLHVPWAFDGSESVIETHQKNFGRHGTQSILANDADFIHSVAKNGYHADIVHYSPPCQAFSSANHNRNEEKDFINQKALFSLHHLTEKLKPRIATIEETAGLMNRHKEWFDALINIFTSIGYSVRWKVVRCQDYGIAQIRNRLLLTAAAPGEKLPRFPAPTHGEEGTGLKPYVKIRQAIYRIPRSATHQDMISESKKPELLKPFSPDTFAKCITTTAGQFNHHPSGTRKYSVRELACLQSFPTDHDFSTQGIVAATREVGNAVPPKLCQCWFEAIIKSLRKTDGLET